MIESTQAPAGVMIRSQPTHPQDEVGTAARGDRQQAAKASEQKASSGGVETVTGGNPLEEQQRAGQAEAQRQPAEGEEKSSTLMLEQVVESINDYLQANQRALEFSLDDGSGQVVVTVRDAERDEVIRQIPPEHALKLMAQMRDGTGISGIGLTEEA
ncbi:flagellar protein FlaG [Marichromatium purpuratum]|uniref:flagellar protein FlaG n=1 Tax=Marichromatium purpuratum TaxID=37487 RepID=UPI001E563543|nr:flagellar protein FlaG [Marichromatium purpuratum]